MEDLSGHLRVERRDGSESRGRAGEALRRMQLSHDVRHGLATIGVIVETLATTRPLSGEVTDCLRGLRSELSSLIALVDEEFSVTEGPLGVRPIRLDVAAVDLVKSLRPATSTVLEVHVQPTQSAVSMVGLWRALRNLLDNAVRAASPTGTVQVRVFTLQGRAIIEVEDNGPGFGLAPRGQASLGLGIVQDFLGIYDGTLEIAPGQDSGCCARITLPAVATLEVVPPADERHGEQPARERRLAIDLTEPASPDTTCSSS